MLMLCPLFIQYVADTAKFIRKTIILTLFCDSIVRVVIKFIKRTVPPIIKCLCTVDIFSQCFSVESMNFLFVLLRSCLHRLIEDETVTQFESHFECTALQRFYVTDRNVKNVTTFSPSYVHAAVFPEDKARFGITRLCCIFSRCCI